MKKSLKISLVEFDVEWENPQANIEFLNKNLENHQSDIVLLPEMFTTGFSMNPMELAEEPFGETFEWMKSKAKEGNCAIVGSIPVIENGKFFNRMYFVTPDETFVYDKKHLFGYGRETEVYSSGDEIVTAEYLGWKFRLTICYDLRFPVWLRNTDDYDVMICPASWPKVRIEQWKAMLKSRAIENLAYTVGINRTGIDGYKLEYNGESKVFNPIGEEQELLKHNPYLLQTEISIKTVQHFREKYKFLEDRDDFEIKQ